MGTHKKFRYRIKIRFQWGNAIIRHTFENIVISKSRLSCFQTVDLWQTEQTPQNISGLKNWRQLKGGRGSEGKTNPLQFHAFHECHFLKMT